MDIADVPLFKGLEPDKIERIRKIVIKRTYPKGATMFIEGQETDGLYIVTSGFVKVLKLHKDGREKTLAILGEGEILGEMTIFGSDLRSATLETLEQSTVLVIPRADFQLLLEEMPELAIRVIEVLSYRLRQSNRQIEELIFFNARSRVICNLVQLANERGRAEKNGIKIILRLTHAELANLIGVSRETTTKVLAELQAGNLIKITSKQIQIVNLDELYRQAM